MAEDVPKRTLLTAGVLGIDEAARKRMMMSVTGDGRREAGSARPLRAVRQSKRLCLSSVIVHTESGIFRYVKKASRVSFGPLRAPLHRYFDARFCLL
jgi:hypothetical protein